MGKTLSELGANRANKLCIWTMPLGGVGVAVLAAGADVQLQNKDGWPAPMVAEAGGYPDIAQLLRPYGATR